MDGLWPPAQRQGSLTPVGSVWKALQIFSRSRPAPRLPDGTGLFAIGDIHGRLDLLSELLAKIEIAADEATLDRKILVFLGDYVDRGASSRGVLESLIADPLPGFEKVCLLGNHEEMFMAFLEEPEGGRAWLANGGDATTQSYGVDITGYIESKDLSGLHGALREAVPAAHRHFLRTLSSHFVEGDYFFTHAGIRPGIALEKQDSQDLIWIREPFLSSKKDHGKVVVHGHSVTFEPEEYPSSDQPSRIGIDTGAYLTERLTCLYLLEDQRRLIMTGPKEPQTN